jgi:hypothetical protein
MFDKNLFPTPKAVIERMIAGIDLNEKTVLEPSAGTGNIVNLLNELGAEVIACEHNEQLRDMLNGKCRIIANDFFDVKSEDVSHIDYIIANPPFDNVDKHILYMWEIAPAGCEIVSLCNATTIENTHSWNRGKLSQIIRENGFSEVIGNVFSNSERKTDVEVAIVKLFKPGATDNFEGYFDLSEEEEYQENGLMSYNAIRDVVNRYVSAVRLYANVIENAVQMNSLVGEMGVKDLSFTCNHKDKEINLVQFKKELQKKSWNYIFNKMNMDRYMTKSLKEQLNRFVEKQQNIPFTMTNVYKMIDMVVQTHGNRMNKVLIEIFDKLTEHYSENRYNVEGWKTNSHYLVNEKFILPWVVEQGFSEGVSAIYNSRNAELLDDFQKALYYLNGEKWDWKTHSLMAFYQTDSSFDYVNKKKVYTKEPKEFGKWYDWHFFEIKGYKKRTVHCKFKSKKVWENFNRAVAEAKGFELPENI